MNVIERHIRKTNQVYYLMLLVAAVLLGCSEKAETEDPVVFEEPERISLAFSSVSSSQNRSRLDNGIVQNGAPYRDIVDFNFMALRKQGDNIKSVTSIEVDNQEEPESKASARYYHYDYCDMPIGVNGCLVYAKAEDVDKPTELEKRAYNGCLTESAKLSDYVYKTDQIWFEPVSIYPDETTIPDEATALADALTYITEANGRGGYWTTFNNEELRSLFSHFTNYGYDLPGSAASVREWIKAVRDRADDLSFGSGTTNEAIRDDIIARADEKLAEIAGLTYPQNINLPDGAAALRWSDVVVEEVTVKKFVPQLQTTTLDDINSVSLFVYPPSLYYRVESAIQTSKNKVVYDEGDGEHGYRYDGNWNTVLSHFTDGGTVTADTKTVAIKDPLQYAVAQLKLKVQIADAITTNELRCDNNGNTVAYTDGTNNHFRLTGVIVGGQRKVGYDFKPINHSDVDVRFVYDSQVPNNFWLKKSSTDELNTLVLQTYDGEDLNVILEFEYTGAVVFRCLNGYVYPNTHFYLVGEVKLPAGAVNEADDYKRRVFTQDYTTTIQMTVSSLEKAYNVLPSINSQNLEIGVMTTPMWIAAVPSDPVVMD